MDAGAWCAAVHGVTKSQTRLSAFTFTFHFHALEKEMTTHYSLLAWRIPGMAEPGGLPSMGSHRVGHDRSDLAAAAAAFLMVQLSYLYLTALKTITLTIQMSLLFNMLAMFVTVPSPPPSPRRKHLLISWLQSLFTVILEPKKVKSNPVSTFPLFPHSICHEVMGSDVMILIFSMLCFSLRIKIMFP